MSTFLQHGAAATLHINIDLQQLARANTRASTGTSTQYSISFSEASIQAATLLRRRRRAWSRFSQCGPRNRCSYEPFCALPLDHQTTGLDSIGSPSPYPSFPGSRSEIAVLSGLFGWTSAIYSVVA